MSEFESSGSVIDVSSVDVPTDHEDVNLFTFLQSKPWFGYERTKGKYLIRSSLVRTF